MLSEEIRTLLYACREYNDKAFHILLEENISIKKKLKENIFLILKEAVSFSKYVSVIIILFEFEENKNIVDEHKRNLLSYAAENTKYLSVIKYLISMKIDLESKDKEGLMPIHYATMVNENIEITKCILKQGNFESIRSLNETTLLMFSVLNNNPEIAKFFLNQNLYGYINLTNRNEENVLHYATKKNNYYEVIELLIKNGVNINQKDKNNFTPIRNALNNLAEKNVIELLIKNASDINIKDKYLNTPLHYAVRNYYDIEVIKMLVENGAKIDELNSEKYTPLLLASENRLIGSDIIEYLILKGANIKAKNHNNENIYALSKENPNITENIELMKKIRRALKI